MKLWSGITHSTNDDIDYSVAGSYVTFGRAMGHWIDGHGARHIKAI